MYVQSQCSRDTKSLGTAISRAGLNCPEFQLGVIYLPIYMYIAVWGVAGEFAGQMVTPVFLCN